MKTQSVAILLIGLVVAVNCRPFWFPFFWFPEHFDIENKCEKEEFGCPVNTTCSCSRTIQPVNNMTSLSTNVVCYNSSGIVTQNETTTKDLTSNDTVLYLTEVYMSCPGRIHVSHFGTDDEDDD